MKLISWYLAHHYLSLKKQESSISLMALIACISIAIGSFSLALVTAVMNGFQVTIHEKMQNIQPQATIYSYKHPIAFQELKQFISKSFPTITALSPYALSHVMVKSQAIEEDETPTVAILKAINPEQEALTTALKTKIIDNYPLTAVQKNQVLIGKTMARNLDLMVGDQFTLLYIEHPSSSKKKKVTVHQKEAVVGGIFETGIDEYDNSTLYSSFDFFNELFPDQGITQVGLAFDSSISPSTILPQLKQEIGLDVLTWQELYRPLLSALTLEKYAMFLILLLITLVASMNIIALIFMMITHKRADIAILQAMGLSKRIIARSFILMGMILSATASIIGLAFAWLASWFIENYPFITLPDVYYVSHLPARMEWHIIGAVFFIVMFITLLAAWFSAKRVQSINIAHVLRFEG